MMRYYIILHDTTLHYAMRCYPGLSYQPRIKDSTYKESNPRGRKTRKWAGRRCQPPSPHPPQQRVCTYNICIQFVQVGGGAGGSGRGGSGGPMRP